ncbi:hypothetical protein HAX54_052723 [Datura stramonium]|uniref:Uncharacterized protein n=1 Tax=Datura stramonium TaxID=4076 RepID=A0ABS8SZC0_DATST|nr:hypothetical protein [Datura stramonium]
MFEEANNNNTHYFIAPQKKEKASWKRVSRIVGKLGKWKPQGKGKEIKKKGKTGDDKKKGGVNNENIRDIEEFINSVLKEEDNINNDDDANCDDDMAIEEINKGSFDY